MVTSCLSLVSFYGSYLRRAFTSAGLNPRSIDIDSHTTLYFWAPEPTGKPSLILIHGFGPRAIWQWRHQVRALSPYFDLYVPDLVFFGESTTTCSERSEVFQAVSVGMLLEKLGVERYSVMGTSYGGFVAYHLGRLWPERVEKVIIANSAVNIKRKDNGELLERAKVEKIEDLMLPKTAAQLRTLLGLAVFNRPRYYLPDFILNDFLDNLYSENREEKKQLLMGLTLGRDETPHITPLQQEVLLVWGEHDQIFPLQKALELREIVGDKVKLEVIKSTSHVPQVEDPKQFNNIVKEFMTHGSS